MTDQHELHLYDRIVPLVRETRCGVVEILHSGAIAMADVDGRLACIGDGQLLAPTRSTLKPFILGALLDTLLMNETFTDGELALMSGSHTGQAIHIQTLYALLKRYGLSESDLGCGLQARSGDGSNATPASNNCSGKHALFLIACVLAGWSKADYLEPSSKIQRSVKDLLERRIFEGALLPGVDGCSLPNYAVTIADLARAYARFGADRLGPGVIRVRRAHLAAPELAGGEGCLDTHLIRRYELAAKSGSDGVWAVGVPLHGLGLVAKAMSGSKEAAQVTLLECLARLFVVPREGDALLGRFFGGPRRNWAGQTVGEVETCFAEFPPTPKY